MACSSKRNGGEFLNEQSNIHGKQDDARSIPNGKDHGSMGTKDAASIPVIVQGSPADVAEDARYEDHDGIWTELLWTCSAGTPDFLSIPAKQPTMSIWKFGLGLHGIARTN